MPINRHQRPLGERILWLGLAAALCGCAKGEFSEASVTVPDGMEVESALGYLAGTGIAYVARRNKELFVMRGSEQDGPFEAYASGDISKNARSIAYLATRGGKISLLLNGKEISQVDCVNARISHDGSSVACMKGDEMGSSVTFANGGFVGHGWYAKKNAIVSKDGKQVGGIFDEVSDLTYDARGGLVFAAKNGEQWQLFRDSAVLASGFKSVTTIVECGDGKVAYEAARDDGSIVGIEGQLGPRFDAVAGLVCQAGVVAYAAGIKQGRSSVYRNGRLEAGEFDEVGVPGLSADGLHLAFYAKRDGRSYFVLDGEERETTTIKSKPWLTFNGELAFAFSDSGDDYAVFANDKKLTTTRGLQDIEPLTRSVLLISKIKGEVSGARWTASISGKELGSYDDIQGVHVGATGSKVGFVARTGRKLQHVVHSE